MTYDCTADIREHAKLVKYFIDDMRSQLEGRADSHDFSKTQPPEKAIFDEYTPKLKELEYGSNEYKAALVAMGEGLQHHYKANRHHPEHFENGVNEMTLIDLIEMVCDWAAACSAKSIPVQLDKQAERFGIAPQLIQIINNTLQDMDYWNTVNNVPITYLSQGGPKQHSDSYWVPLS